MDHSLFGMLGIFSRNCGCADVGDGNAYDDKMQSKIRKAFNNEVIELQARKRNMWTKRLFHLF